MHGVYCLIVFLSHNALLLLSASTHTLTLSPHETQYGRAGETVVLSPGTITEKLLKAHWKYNGIKILDMDIDVEENQFSGRVSMNKSDYSLTIRDPKTTDSGDFTFVSAGRKGQRTTPEITLIFQEVLSQTPTVDIINITQLCNESCEVFVTCTSRYEKDVSYSWKVRDVKSSASTLQYRLKPQEGDIPFTCTVSNMVSYKSASKSINCKTPPSPPTSGPTEFLVIVAGAAAGVLLLVAVAFVVFWRCKKAPAAEANDEMTVYAEIDEVSTSKIMKPCSVYETVESKTPAVKPKAQTVYDQIQFSRLQHPQNR